MNKMTTRKKQKHRRFRGHRTHHGAHRKWRGGGSRGGRGLAGGHKHKWSYVVKYDKVRFGKEGFKRPPSAISKSRTINLGDIDRMMNHFIDKKFAEKEGASIKIDLTKAGYDKVLGTGKINKPFVIHAKSFSKSAIKKLEEAGGKAVKI
jgi:large subunit ribosomal protein L15